MKTKVVAMAFQRKEAESQISHYSLQLAKHIMKLFLFPDSPHAKGWIKEVRAWYLTCRKYGNNLKGGKAFKAKEYMEFLFQIPFGKGTPDIKEIQDQMVEQNEGLTAKPIELYELKGMLTALYAVMCESLAQDTDWQDFVHHLSQYTNTD